MADELILVDGCTFFMSDENGDVEIDRPQGYFFDDVRHLSQWCLLVGGKRLEALTSRRVDYYSARIVSAPGGGDPPFSVRRDRFVADGVHEDVVITNHTSAQRLLELELRFAADFADVLEAQEPGAHAAEASTDAGDRTATLLYEQDTFRRGTRITFSRRGKVRRDAVSFTIAVDPHETWELCIDVAAIVGRRRYRPLLRCGSFSVPEPEMPLTLEQWRAAAPALVADSDDLRHTYAQSQRDLAALRLRPRGSHVRWALPAGGVPWFMAVFGRDSLIASYEALPFHPTLAETTLETLAEHQATERDDFRDAEPGKILHELRRGKLVQLGVDPHGPYYGTHDATALFLIVLDEYERWTGDDKLARRLEPAARRALQWIDEHADLDGDGLLEYESRSSKGLRNHCWKDSDRSIQFPDGRIADPPIATCEIQGYAYDARLRVARLAREVWNDEELAAEQERRAAQLRERFDAAFWSDELDYYVLALDGDKRPVDAVTSNPGHLLWSRIVSEDRAKKVVERLLEDDLFSGWGIRCLSSRMRGYNPLEYHNGTVWPHDSVICAEGMRRYGFRDEAAAVALAVLEAAAAFGQQLPEVFAGFARDATNVPIPYPGALSPQAWAAGAPLLALRTLLGLDVVEGRLRSDPHVPRELGRINLRGVPFRGKRVDLVGRG